MPDIVYVLPDVVTLTLQYLRLRPEVTALVPAGNIVSAMPDSISWPYVIVNAAGGQGIWPSASEDAVQLDCYTTAKDTCSLLARTVRAAMWAIRNEILPAGVMAISIEEQAPQWIPDQLPTPAVPLPRFVQRHRILIHP